MKKVLIRCDNQQGGLSYFIADYDGLQLFNFTSQATGKRLFQNIQVSFCPDGQYLHGEFTGRFIENVKVFNKRTEEQRQNNMIAIASLVQSKFRL